MTVGTQQPVHSRHSGRGAPGTGRPPADAERTRRTGRGWPRWVLAAAPAVVTGALLGWVMPRGPMSPAGALVAIAVALATGVVGGVVWRSRWAMVVVPAAHLVAYEVLRIGYDGPTVDLPVLSWYGLMALVVGRGLTLVVVVVPMVLGVIAGRAAVRLAALDRAADRGRTTWPVVRLTTVVLVVVGLTVAFGRPARTAPILDADGEPLAGSIAELDHVEINGRDLGVMLRGHSVDNPVLLFLAGGPGGSELGAMRRHLSALEEHFTVATWDQRGTGRSYAALDPVDTYTPDSAVDDTIAMTDHLRERFGVDRVYLLGQSWGSLLGVLAAQERPDLYHAFIGTGQMVDIAATDRITYRDTLDWARDTGRDDLVASLEDMGPPPYDDVLNYESAVGHEMDLYPYDHSPNAEGAGQMGENLLVSEYALVDLWHVFAATMDTYAHLYPQIQDIDFRTDATELEVPVYFAQGRFEAGGRAEVFDEWYAELEAPVTHLEIFETSGHRPLWEQPQAFTDFMADTVLSGTS